LWRKIARPRKKKKKKKGDLIESTAPKVIPRKKKEGN